MAKKKTLLLFLFSLVIILFVGFKKNIDTGDMQRDQSAHFIIYHQGMQAGTLKDIEQKLENAYPPVQQFLNLRTAYEQRVVVYPSVEHFQNAYLGYILSWFFGDWAAGAAYRETLLLTSPDNPGSRHSYDDMLDVAVHEYVHTQIYRVNPSPDIWLDEGIATYLAGQRSSTEGIAPPTFAQFQSQDQSQFVENHGYAWAYHYIDYLQERYETDGVVCLLRTDDYDACLSQSKRQVYREWLASR